MDYIENIYIYLYIYIYIYQWVPHPTMLSDMC